MPKTGIRSYETQTKGLRWLAYYHRDGKQVLKRGFRTSRQAEQWRSEALTRATSPADTTITVGEWIGEWLKRHRAHIRPSTYARYNGALRTWVLPHLALVRLTALTHRHIEAMHEEAIQASRSPHTIRRNHTPLRAALQEAERDGIIVRNPATLVRLPPLQKAEIDPFTQAEVQQFLVTNQDRLLYPVYHLALNSGLRLGEILALRVGRDISPTGRTITVRETRRRGVTGPPKSKESARQVVLHPTAAEVLADVIADQGDGALAFPINEATVSHSMAGACKAAGVRQRRFHDLRHTHATLLLASGANIRAVSARLGHATAAFTLQIYGHVLPGMDEALAEASHIFNPGHYQNSITPITRNGHREPQKVAPQHC